MTRSHSLHVETGVRERSAETHLLVGGAALLLREQWTDRRGGPRTHRPVDPVGLLRIHGGSRGTCGPRATACSARCCPATS
jgi:hypothetical protein